MEKQNMQRLYLFIHDNMLMFNFFFCQTILKLMLECDVSSENYFKTKKWEHSLGILSLLIGFCFKMQRYNKCSKKLSKTDNIFARD